MRLPRFSPKYLLAAPVVVGSALLVLSAPTPGRRPEGRTNATHAGPLKVTGTFSANGASTFGSPVSAPVLDGGALIGTTLNTSGAAVIGGNMTVQGTLITGASATAQMGNIQLLTGGAFNNQTTCDRRGAGAGGTFTCNTHAGCHTMAAGASSRQISNSQVGTSTICQATWGGTIDATCTAGPSCEADAGVLIFRSNDNCTAAADFCWTVETGP